MSFAVGSSLSHYTILGPLGAGAMGEVYRARDSKLGREVAIKVLPEHFADDEERLKRFEREAKTLASLNHPNVAQIHGVDQVGDTCFLVLELVPGESLEERLKRGPLPLDEALDVCRQIAEGLEAAHEAGVIHRDLKPANVRVTPEGRVKVLDFGLAKSAQLASGTGSSTDSVLSTEAGRLLGTPTYMAPEQARGKSIDKRVDIWAFGCVLYECLTARRAFAGETLSDVLAAVIEREPEWSRLPAATPPHVRALLARCLCKDPRERLRDAGDARLELATTASPEGRAGAALLPRRSVRGAWVALAFAAGAVLSGLALWLARSPALERPSPVRRFALHGTGMPIDAFQGIALSRDGRRLVYRAIDDAGRERLFLRAMDALEAKPLPGTESGYLPFFSPDGDDVGFHTRGILKAVTISNGIARSIAAIEGGFSGGAWLDDGSILWASSAGRRIGRVRATGGEVEYHEVAGSHAGDLVLGLSPLPGGEAVLCALRRGSTFDVALYDLAGHALTVIAPNGFTPIYAASGHVVYQQGQDGPLMALPFDAERRKATGPAFPVISDLGSRVSIQVRMFALADDGTLAYIPRTRLLDSGALVWMDRTGQSSPIVDVGKTVDMPRLSHDGRRIAFRTPAPDCGIWVHDLERAVTNGVTREGDNHGIVWLPDDERLAFARLVQPPGWSLLAAPADGAGEIETLSEPSVPRGFASSCTPDGESFLIGAETDTGRDVYLGSVQQKSARPLLHSRFSEHSAVFSPDGRSIAYVSDEDGTEDVYVQPFPALDARQKISTGGGTDPVWARDGKELFFLSDRKMMVVAVTSSPTFVAGRPHMLFEAGDSGRGSSGLASYDVSADGQRFVMVRGPSSSGGAEVHIVLDWFEELRALAPKVIH